MSKSIMRRTAAALLIAAATTVGAGAWAQNLPGFGSWDEVVEQARGETVFWFMWGGSDAINGFVDEFYGKPLKEEYNITLNRVPLADTVDAVNQVISEQAAGATGDKGSIDLIWINGENFFTLRQADLLYGPWADGVPNAALVDWDNPAINLDFGRPVEGYESPWSSAQFHFVYDSARLQEADLPRSYAELTSWIEQNPGRFSYIAPGPGAFVGTRFVKQLFFELSGGQAQWVGPFDQALYDKWAPKVWKTLVSWKPNLWRAGETYPASNAELRDLFARLQALRRLGARSAVLTVAEGARVHLDGKLLSTVERDDFGEYCTGGVAELVAAHIQRELGWEARAMVLGHLQRAGRPVAFDRIFALRLGARAANLCLSGGYGRMAALQNGEIVDIPLAEAVASIRKLRDHFLNRYENFFAAEPDPVEPRT